MNSCSHRGRLRAAVLVLAIALVSTVVPGCSGERREQEAQEKKSGLTILFSSDLLGMIRSCGCAEGDTGGLGRRATYTKGVREHARNLLVLDAGDAFSLDLSFSKEEAQVTLESFSLMGVDVFTPGENEFIFGLPFLQAAAENASFETIAANVVDPSSAEPIFGAAFTVRELSGGIRVASTGVLDDAIRFPSYIDRSLFRVDPVEESLRRIIPQMQQEADFLILLSHMGVKRTRDLLDRVDEFDIAVVGHGKPLMKTVEKVGKTLLIGTGGLGQYIGQMDMIIAAGGEIEYSRFRLVPLSEDLRIDIRVRDLFEAYGLAITDK